MTEPKVTKEEEFMPAPRNENTLVVDALQLESLDNGGLKEWKSPPIPAEYASSFEAFLVALALDADVRLTTTWARSGDGNFFKGGNSGTAIVDSGAGSDAKVGLIGSGTSGTETIGAFVQFKIGVQARTGASRVTAGLRLNSVFKAS